MNLRFVLFMSAIMLGFTIIGNITDGYNYLTDADVQDIDTMRQYSETTTTSSVWDNAITFVTGGFEWLRKITTFDYSMFKDINNHDPVTGQPLDNDFVIIRYALIIAGVVCVVDIILILFGRAPA